MRGIRQRVGVFIVVLCAALSCAATAYAAAVPVAPGKATASGFLPASGCTCHSGRVGEWEGSMHAKALRDPVFVAKAAEAEAKAGAVVAAFCRRCHGPVADMTGSRATGAIGAEAVTCMYCHQAVGNAGEPGNTSHLLVTDLTRRAQVKDPVAPHAAAYSAFHASAALCGGCHDVRHPVNGTPLESTYSEWKASAYAKRGTTCQDCHMGLYQGAIGPSIRTAANSGPQRPGIYAMSFVGANVAQDDPDAARELLRGAASVRVAMPQVVAAGEKTPVEVTVANVGAGHSLPTGLTEVRQMWLRVWAMDADGTKTTVGEHVFGTVLEDAAGRHPVEVWEATGVRSDDRIPAGGSARYRYSFTMPQDGGKAEVFAALYYKSLPDEAAAAVGVDNPVTTMAETRRVVYGSQADLDAARTDRSRGSVWPTVAAVAFGMLAAVALLVALRRKGR